MKVHLLNRPDFQPQDDIAPFKEDLCQDLVLDPILKIMGKGDNYVEQQCRMTLLMPLTDRANLLHRQSALRDAIRNSKTILQLYATVAEVVTDISNYKTSHRNGNPLPAVRVLNAVEQLDLLANGLQRLKDVIVNTYGHFTGVIFRDFYDAFLKEFNAEFVRLVHEKATLLRKNSNNEGEIQISGRIGNGLKADGFVVNVLSEYQSKRKIDIMESLFSTKIHKNEIRISYDDLELNRDCRDLQSAGLLHVASTFDSFSLELMRMFNSLRQQLAFYHGCCNLYNHMKNMVFPVCFPEVNMTGSHAITGKSFYDLGVAVRDQRLPATNDLSGEDTLTYLITGTNHGGKTTFIRSIATSQLMAQCGMFVPAQSMETQIFTGFFTHFVRSEDASMTAGKLEEELRRLSKIVDNLTSGSIIFLNESFATTSERDAAAIAEDIVRAFYDNEITCFFVTHIYAFAKKAYDAGTPRMQFLQAERTMAGERTYRMKQGEPSVTGYGMELYEEIINDRKIIPDVNEEAYVEPENAVKEDCEEKVPEGYFDEADYIQSIPEEE